MNSPPFSSHHSAETYSHSLCSASQVPSASSQDAAKSVPVGRQAVRRSVAEMRMISFFIFVFWLKIPTRA